MIIISVAAIVGMAELIGSEYRWDGRQRWRRKAQVDGIHVSPEISRSMELGVVGMVKMKCGGKSGG